MNFVSLWSGFRCWLGIEHHVTCLPVLFAESISPPTCQNGGTGRVDYHERYCDCPVGEAEDCAQFWLIVQTLHDQLTCSKDITRFWPIVLIPGFREWKLVHASWSPLEKKKKQRQRQKRNHHWQGMIDQIFTHNPCMWRTYTHTRTHMHACTYTYTRTHAWFDSYRHCMNLT